MALEPCCQIGEVGWIEADGGAEVDGAQLSALDEALDGPGMDAKEAGCLLRREERRSGARLRLNATRGDRRLRASLPVKWGGSR